MIGAVLTALALTLTSACEEPDPPPACASVGSPPPTPAAGADAPTPAHDVSLDAVVWMQRSLEYDAVTTAAYGNAKRMLDVALADPAWTAAPEQGDDARGKKTAIILDVDETVLDNSPYAAWLMRTQQDFDPTTWSAWCAAAEAEAIPGAVTFTQYAASKGVDVYFVTNRDREAEPGTLANLRRHGFPVDEAGERLMLRGERPEWTTDKGTRRALIAEDHRILLLVGDNLGDFVDGAKADAAARRALWDAHADAWGTAWIMLPNPDYGTWEDPLYATTQRLDAAQQRDKKLAALKAWAGPPAR